MSKNEAKDDVRPIWTGRPSVSVYYWIYGIISIVLAVVLVVMEIWLGESTTFGRMIFPSSVKIIIRLPYPAELITATIIFLGFLVQSIRLAVIRMQNKYELREDGLYMNLGLVNLENVYVSPMSFSDARLFRSWSLRLAKRGNIIVDTNDQRHFMLRLLRDPVQAQAMIRSAMGKPTVRIG